MSPTSSKLPFVICNMVAPSLLICALSAAALWHMQRPVGPPLPGPERYAEVALWSGIGLGAVCWIQLLALSWAQVDLLRDLATQVERSEQEKLSQAAEAMQLYTIFMLDPQGYIASWGRDTERLLGYTVGDAVTRHISMFYSDQDARQGKPAHDLMTATIEGRFDDERWLARKDGFRFKASISIVAIRDPAGNLCGFTNVIREDISDPSE